MLYIFLLGDSKASEFYVLTFRNTLSVPTSYVMFFLLTLPAKMEILHYFLLCDYYSPYDGRTQAK